MDARDRHRRLVLVRSVHTVVWAAIAGCVLAVPVLAHRGHLKAAAVAALVVVAEIGVLALNRGRCPLTDVAARYTADRRANFDIYLPEPIARHNKVIFGTLFVMGGAYALFRATVGSP